MSRDFVMLSTSPSRQRNIGLHTLQQPQRNGIFRVAAERPFDSSAFRNVFAGGRAHHEELVPLRVGTHAAHDCEDPHMLLRAEFESRSTTILCAGVSLWFLLIGCMFVMYSSFSSNMAAAQTAAQPFIWTAVNSTLKLLDNVEKSTVSARVVSGGVERLAMATLIPNVERVLNASNAIVSRLERLAQRPTLKVSLDT